MPLVQLLECYCTKDTFSSSYRKKEKKEKRKTKHKLQ